MTTITLQEYFDKGGKYQDLKELKRKVYGKLPKVSPTDFEMVRIIYL